MSKRLRASERRVKEGETSVKEVPNADLRCNRQEGRGRGGGDRGIEGGGGCKMSMEFLPDVLPGRFLPSYCRFLSQSLSSPLPFWSLRLKKGIFERIKKFYSIKVWQSKVFHPLPKCVHLDQWISDDAPPWIPLFSYPLALCSLFARYRKNNTPPPPTITAIPPIPHSSALMLLIFSI